jgi:hypothetical protein
MFRPSCRLVAAVLWLAIALLPLRVVAAGWMSPGIAAASAASAAADALPCHGMPADAADEAGNGAPMHHVCNLCDLCHAGVTVAPEPPALALASAVQERATRPLSPHGRVAPDGLFRPPR